MHGRSQNSAIVAVQIARLNFVVVSVGPVQLVLVKVDCQPVGPFDVRGDQRLEVAAGQRASSDHGVAANVTPEQVAFAWMHHNGSWRVAEPKHKAHVRAWLVTRYYVQLAVRVVDGVRGPIVRNAFGLVDQIECRVDANATFEQILDGCVLHVHVEPRNLLLVYVREYDFVVTIVKVDTDCLVQAGHWSPWHVAS